MWGERSVSYYFRNALRAHVGVRFSEGRRGQRAEPSSRAGGGEACEAGGGCGDARWPGGLVTGQGGLGRAAPSLAAEGRSSRSRAGSCRPAARVSVFGKTRLFLASFAVGVTVGRSLSRPRVRGWGRGVLSDGGWRRARSEPGPEGWQSHGAGSPAPPASRSLQSCNFFFSPALYSWNTEDVGGP